MAIKQERIDLILKIFLKLILLSNNTFIHRLIPLQLIKSGDVSFLPGMDDLQAPTIFYLTDLIQGM